MSAAPVFILKLSVPPEEAESQLNQLWQGFPQKHEAFEIRTWPVEILGESLAHVFPPYYFYTEECEQYLRKTIAYLFSVSEECNLYYLRDWDTFDDQFDWIYPDVITVDELVEKFEPGMFNVTPWLFQLKPEPEPEINQKTIEALQWMTDILNRLEIPYQVTGGLAAKCYGASRPLHDIDIYVPHEAMKVLENELSEYVEFGPALHKDNHWDIIFMKFNYKGQIIEFGDADHTKYFDSDSRLEKWTKEEIDFSTSVMMEFKNITLPVMPKDQLVTYKKRLDREVDRMDLSEIY